MSAPPSEERELALVEKVELRIALAETDSKLSTLLKTYLGALLLKLASPHVKVRNKVISVCQHINTRLQSPSVELPVGALLKQFIEQETKLIRHFDLLYAQQGFKRLSGKEKHEIVPSLIKGIAGVIGDAKDQNGATFFNLFLQALHHYEWPRKGSKEDDGLRKSLEMSDEDAKALAGWFEKLVLLEIGKVAETGLPGVTDDEKKFLNVYSRPGVWDPADSAGMGLRSTKLLVLKFLSTGAFTDDERVMPALFASAHRDSNIVDRGEDLLKHAIADVNIEDASFITRLYEVYLGTKDRPPASTPLQIKILTILQRSLVSAGYTRQCLEIIERGVSTKEGGPQGREAAKLQAAVFNFANFFFRHGENVEVKNVAPTVVRKMQSFVNDQGWPAAEESADLSLRTRSYELIGTCAKAGVVQDINLLDWLFQSLREDTSGRDTSLAIEHALAMMIDTFSFLYQSKQAKKSVDGDIEMADGAATIDDLAGLLLRHVEDEATAKSDGLPRRSTRYIAARFANRCLPYENAIGRWMDILAVGGGPGEKMEVVEEGKKGLDPAWFTMLNSDRKDLWAKVDGEGVQFPSFAPIFKQAFSSSSTVSSWGLKRGALDDEPDAVYSSFTNRYPFALMPALTYCWRVFVNRALEQENIEVPIDSEWERKVENGTRQDLDIRKAVKRYIGSVHSKGDPEAAAFSALLSITYQAMTSKDGAGLNGAHDLLLQMLSVCPQPFAKDVCKNLSVASLISCIKSNDQHIRTAAARVFGIISLHSRFDNIKGNLEGFVSLSEAYKDAIGAGINEINGYIKAASFSLSELAYEASTSYELLKDLVQRLWTLVRTIVSTSKDQTLLDAAFTAIEQFSIFGITGSSVKLEAKETNEIIDTVFVEAEKGKEMAISALGRFGVCLPETEEKESNSIGYLEEKLYKLHEIRETNTQFAVGEALCCLACGWENTALQLVMDADLAMPGNKKKLALPRILEQVIKNCKAPKPSLRRASVIWLLCLVQFCGHLPEVQSQLRACQAAFGNSLSERDDLVQEAASRGLGIVYEKGDRQLRDDLVKDLMKSFSSDKSNLAGNVEGDTMLFDPGALRTGEGDSSITTYKDILSLASEIGNPGLVYQFMSLAANNAVWTNRAAFANSGLKTILADSGVGGYLAENPKLYAKLFRYRFDPNTNVQRSMSDIWHSLVKDSNATIDKYFEPIMDDLLANILTKEWRVRQACCDAISDLVQGRQLAKYEKYLTDIWTNCFKVLDDIKETVRVAAMKLSRVLSQILIRNLEAGDSSLKSAEAMLKQVLPFLLSGSGLESSAKETQVSSIVMILDIVKKASPKALRPFVPELVERMLSLFTDLEDERVNILHMKAAEYKITEEKLDNMRLSAVRSSPVMEAVDQCFDMLDAETMEKTATSIERAMKAAVGLPSKLACGNSLISLTLRHRELFRPYVGRFLKLLEKHSLDRNDTASSTYAAASGYLCKIATDKQILKLIDFAKSLYLTDEDEKHRSVSAEIVRTVSKQVPDRFNSLAADILPFVFLAKHDGQEHIKDLNTKVWEDHVGTSAVSLYLKEIMELSQGLLDSPRWNLKHSAARTIADATSVLAGGYDGISEDQAAVIWPALKKALEGKTWEGKEVVVEALAGFAEKAKGRDLRAKITADVVKIAIREAKRQNKDYQQYAIGTLGKVSAAFNEAEKTNWHKEVIAIVEPVIEDLVSTYMDKMDVDGRDAYLEDKRREKTLCACIESLEQSFNPKSAEAQAQLVIVLGLIEKATAVHMKGVESSIFSSLEALFKQLDAGMKIEDAKISQLLENILFQQNSGLLEAARSQRAKALVSLAQVTSLAGALESMKNLDAEVKQEPSQAVQNILKEALANMKQ